MSAPPLSYKSSSGRRKSSSPSPCFSLLLRFLRNLIHAIYDINNISFTTHRTSSLCNISEFTAKESHYTSSLLQMVDRHFSQSIREYGGPLQGTVGGNSEAIIRTKMYGCEYQSNIMVFIVNSTLLLFTLLSSRRPYSDALSEDGRCETQDDQSSLFVAAYRISFCSSWCYHIVCRRL
jgi:hypothetical protein